MTRLTMVRSRTPSRDSLLIMALAVLGVTGWGCEKAEQPSPPSPAPVPASKLPPLTIVKPLPKPAGESPTRAVHVDRQALDQACAAAKVPAPPDLNELPPLMAQAVYDTIGLLVEERAAAAFGQLGLLYQTVAGDADELLRAAECFEAAKTLEPAAFEWPYRLGKVFFRRGSTERADLEFARAEQLNPDYAMVHWWRGQVDLAAKRAGQAQEHFDRYVALRPEDAAGYTARAATQVLAGDLEAALTAAQEAVRLQPDDRKAHTLLGQLHARMGQRALALREQRIAESLPTGEGGLLRDPIELAAWNPLPREVVMLCIDVLAAQGDPADAAALCEVLLRDEPDNGRLALTLAKLLAAAGRLDEAAQRFEAALRHQPDDAAAHADLGAVLVRLGRPAEAEPHLRRAAELEPDNATYRLRLGGLLAASGQDAEAAEQLQAATRLAPQSANAHRLLGDLSVRKGEFAAAREHYHRALSASPEMAEVYLNLHSLARREQNPDLALDMLRQGLRNLPDSPLLANTLAWRLATDPVPARRNGEEALRWAERACQATQYGDSAVLDTLAAALAEAGRFEEAAKTQREAIELARDSGRENFREQFNARLSLYQAGQPYREPE